MDMDTALVWLICSNVARPRPTRASSLTTSADVARHYKLPANVLGVALLELSERANSDARDWRSCSTALSSLLNAAQVPNEASITAKRRSRHAGQEQRQRGG